MHPPDNDNADKQEHQVQQQRGVTSAAHPPRGIGNNGSITGPHPSWLWWRVVFLPPIGGPSIASQRHLLLEGGWSSGDAASTKGSAGTATRPLLWALPLAAPALQKGGLGCLPLHPHPLCHQSPSPPVPPLLIKYGN